MDDQLTEAEKVEVFNWLCESEDAPPFLRCWLCGENVPTNEDSMICHARGHYN
jgi:hypothetical protein